ncbi:MAG: hypothetical protein ACOCWG_06135 [bacterium]
MSEKIIEPIIKPPKIEVDKKLLEDIKEQTDKEKQVIVHCYFIVPFMCSSIRIRHETYLKSKDGSFISSLITAIKIAIYPDWSFVRSGMLAEFTLCFSGFSDDSDNRTFTVFEDVGEHGFRSPPILKNDSDVYTTELFV